MKKVSAVLIVILVGLIFYATTVTKVYFDEITVPNTLAKVQKKLSDIKKIGEWYLPFANDTIGNKYSYNGNPLLTNASSSLEIEKSTSQSVSYNIKEKDKIGKIIYSIIVDSAKQCRVRVNYESTLLSKWVKSNSINTNSIKSLFNLKEYLTDTKKMYGYEIETVEVTDTAFLFLSTISENKLIRENTKVLFESLIKVCNEKKGNYNGTRIFYSTATDKDSTQLFASIGITNTNITGEMGNIILKRMPYKNKLLVAYYQGKYKNITLAHSKLYEYKQDHDLVGVALPFTKYLTDGYDFADEQTIQAIVCLPVF